MNPVHSLQSCFFRPILISSTHLHPVLPNCFFTCFFFNQDSERTSLLSHVCTTLWPSYLSWADEEDLPTYEISEYYINCTSGPPTWKISTAALLAFLRVENCEVITMVNIFLPSFLKSTHLFKSYLDTHTDTYTHYIPIIPTYPGWRGFMQLLLATRDSGYFYLYRDETHDCWRHDLGNVGTSKVTKHAFTFAQLPEKLYNLWINEAQNMCFIFPYNVWSSIVCT